jgi:signal transduction histidine kinase
MVQELFEGVESERHVEYQYQGPGEIAIVATRDELRVALWNLVDNAVRHNDSDNPEVWVRTTRHPGETDSLEIAVLDNGPGIPEAERKTITRGRETSLKHSSGVGLWTVRWIVRNLGGTISFEDREPTGTVVRLVFPMPSAESRETDDTGAVDSLDDGR